MSITVFPQPKVTSSNVLFCSNPKDIQFIIIKNPKKIQQVITSGRAGIQAIDELFHLSVHITPQVFLTQQIKQKKVKTSINFRFCKIHNFLVSQWWYECESIFLAIPESSWHHEHPGWCVRHHARSGWGSRPDHAAEAPSPDQLPRTLQQLEPGLHHPPLCWQGQPERTRLKFGLIIHPPRRLAPSRFWQSSDVRFTLTDACMPCFTKQKDSPQLGAYSNFWK